MYMYKKVHERDEGRSSRLNVGYTVPVSYTHLDVYKRQVFLIQMDQKKRTKMRPLK